MGELDTNSAKRFRDTDREPLGAPTGTGPTQCSRAWRTPGPAQRFAAAAAAAARRTASPPCAPDMAAVTRAHEGLTIDVVETQLHLHSNPPHQVSNRRYSQMGVAKH